MTTPAPSDRHRYEPVATASSSGRVYADGGTILRRLTAGPGGP